MIILVTVYNIKETHRLNFNLNNIYIYLYSWNIDSHKKIMMNK
jgi:hypothetical protein